MSLDVELIRSLMVENRKDFETAAIYFRHKRAALFRYLYRDLREADLRNIEVELRKATAAGRERVFRRLRRDRIFYYISLPYTARRRIEEIQFEARLRRGVERYLITVDKLLAEKADFDTTRTQSLLFKGRESRYLADLNRAVTRLFPERKTWAERLLRLRVAVKERIKKIEEIIKPPALFYRVHKSHMFYATEPGEQTPTPWLMVSVFVYTQNPTIYKEGELNRMLEVAEYGTPSEVIRAFPKTVWWEGIMQLDENVQAGLVDYNSDPVEGVEREPVDSDEVQYDLDELRWYVLVYANPHAGRRKGYEYYGPIERKIIDDVEYYGARLDNNAPEWKRQSLPGQVPYGWQAPWWEG